MKSEEKILTRDLVKELGLDKVSVITADMIDGYTSIGVEAFEDYWSLKSIEIPNSVTWIQCRAFHDCASLTSIKIPNSITHIGDWAFATCYNLTNIEIPNSVTKIGKWAFEHCFGLAFIVIPDGITNIGCGAFLGCDLLKSITIPNSVTWIGEKAFYDCTCLTSVMIGDKTYEKQTPVNGKCKAYKAFKSNMTCRYFQYEEGKTYEFEGEPILGKQGFHACLNLSEVFDYYYGEFGKNIVVHEVELENVSDERNKYGSIVVTKKITIGKRIL